MADELPHGFTIDHDPLPAGFSLDSAGTAGQGAFEETIRQLIPNAPKSVTNALIGLAQGIRELGHGTAERLGALGAMERPGVSYKDAMNSPMVQGFQQQEQAYNQLHPDQPQKYRAIPAITPGAPGEITPGAPTQNYINTTGDRSVFDTPASMEYGRDIAHLAPYLAGGPLEGAILGGISQPLRPGENPLSAPIASLAGTAIVGLPIAVLNKTITKAYNAGALKDTIDSIGIPKADLNKQGAYQAIKDFAENSTNLPPGTPALKQADKAKAFVSTIESLSPSAAVALRSDVGANYLQHAIKSTELYATRDALGAKLGAIDTQPIVDQINSLLQQPEMQARLAGKGAVATRSMDILQNGANPQEAFQGINLANQPDSVKAAFGLLMNPAAKVDYATLSAIRSNLDKANTALAKTGDPASGFYKQASKIIDDFQGQLAAKAGGDLANADKMARAYYKNSVVPYLEKGLAQKLSDPKMESQALYKMFTDYTDKNPERAQRMYNLISDDGKAAVRGGYISDMLAANTDRNGYIEPVGIRDFLESTPKTANRYLVSPEDRQFIQGISNLVDAHATMPGRSAETYQKYLMARGSENIFLGEFAKGAQQISMPFYYNWIYKTAYHNQTIKRFIIASSKLNPNSPEAAQALVKFTRLMRQAGIGELSTSDKTNQAVNTLLNTNFTGEDNGLER